MSFVYFLLVCRNSTEMRRFFMGKMEHIRLLMWLIGLAYPHAALAEPKPKVPISSKSKPDTPKPSPDIFVPPLGAYALINPLSFIGQPTYAPPPGDDVEVYLDPRQAPSGELVYIQYYLESPGKKPEVYLVVRHLGPGIDPTKAIETRRLPTPEGTNIFLGPVSFDGRKVLLKSGLLTGGEFKDAAWFNLDTYQLEPSSTGFVQGGDVFWSSDGRYRVTVEDHTINFLEGEQLNLDFEWRYYDTQSQKSGFIGGDNFFSRNLAWSKHNRIFAIALSKGDDVPRTWKENDLQTGKTKVVGLDSFRSAYDLIEIDLTGERKPRLIWPRANWMSVSPDGHYLAVFGFAEEKQFRVQAKAHGQSWTKLKEPLDKAPEAPRLFFLDLQNNNLDEPLVSLPPIWQSGSADLEKSLNSGGKWDMAWQHDSQTLELVHKLDDTFENWRVNVKTREATRGVSLSNYSDSYPGSFIQSIPDGKVLLRRTEPAIKISASKTFNTIATAYSILVPQTGIVTKFYRAKPPTGVRELWRSSNWAKKNYFLGW